MSRAQVLVVVGNAEGGGTQIALAAIRALDPARYQVTVVAPEDETLASECAAIGARYAPLPLLDSRVGRDVLTRLAAFIAQGSFDIIHAHGTRAAWFVTRCLPARGAPPLIYSDHIFAFEARRGLARAPWLATEAYLCRRATHVTAPCESDSLFAERVRSRSAPRVRIRHYGIDARAVVAQAQESPELAPATQTFLRQAGPGAPLIGSVGRLIAQKGLRYLVEAAPRILQARPDARFLIVGDGPEREPLTERCRALGVVERFHFAGALARPWSLLARCDVIALPSLWEGMPLTLLEALALGLPVAITPVGVAAQALGADLSAGLTHRRDAGALAHTINRLLDDDGLRERFRRDGPGIAARYDIRETQRAFAALYDELCHDIHGAASLMSQPGQVRG